MTQTRADSSDSLPEPQFLPSNSEENALSLTMRCRSPSNDNESFKLPIDLYGARKKSGDLHFEPESSSEDPMSSQDGEVFSSLPRMRSDELPPFMLRERSGDLFMRNCFLELGHETSGLSLTRNDSTFSELRFSRHNSRTSFIDMEPSDVLGQQQSQQEEATYTPPPLQQNAGSCPSGPQQVNQPQQPAQPLPPMVVNRRRSERFVDSKRKRFEDSESDFSDDTDDTVVDDDRSWPPKKGAKPSPAKRPKRTAANKMSQPKKNVHNQRGAHVKGRVEMQETARKGQEHWAEKVKEMREWWTAQGLSQNHHFHKQMGMCKERHIKNQHECLIRALHLSHHFGYVQHRTFKDRKDEAFLGWTGFTVIPKHASEFKNLIDSMFPSTPLENTLHNTFRRAGLVPESWGPAWLGLAPFFFKKPEK